MTEYDSPWKEALDRYFESFMALCFPRVSEHIDWSVLPRMLDKELQQIAPQSDTGRRSVDKLVEVQLLSGKAEWLLIHLEIQSQPVAKFSKRMFVYFYRISDKFDRPVISLAVLGDDDPNWHPGLFQQETFGCRVEFEFPTLKLLDFSNQIEVLEQSVNPFATVVLAHLMTMKTAGSPRDRSQWKIRLLRPLYSRGFSAEDVRALFRLIDWMMDLPTDIAIEFENELRKLEEENKMPYVTSIEQRGIEKGREEGLEEGLEKGRVAGQIQLLQRLLGLPEAAMSELSLHPLVELQSQLESLQKDLTSRKV